PPEQMVRFRLDFPAGFRVGTGAGVTRYALAVSPDGRTIAYIGGAQGSTADPQLFVRTLDDLQPRALAGTEGAYSPFFSPDGKWIGFAAGLQLKKVPVAGGSVVELGEAGGP